MLDVADAAFDLPLGPRPTGTAGLGVEPRSRQKASKPGIPDHLPGLAIVGGHQGRGVIAEDLLGEAAEVPEGAVEALEPIVLPLGEEGPAVEPARVPQDGGHQVDLHGLTGDPHDLLAEVDLHLLTRRGLEPDRGQGLGPCFLSEGRDGPLQGPQLDVDPSTGQFLLDDDGVSLGDGAEESCTSRSVSRRDDAPRGVVENRPWLRRDNGGRSCGRPPTGERSACSRALGRTVRGSDPRPPVPASWCPPAWFAGGHM